MTDDTQTSASASSAHASTFSQPLVLRWLHPACDPVSFHLRAGTTRIGRDRDCNVRLANKRVSRVHAEIRREGPILVIRNLSSTNRLYVNGVRVDHGVIHESVVVRLGDYVGAFLPPGSYEESPLLTQLAPGFLAGPRLRAAVDGTAKFAASDLPVLVAGATGSGKEVLASAIHHWSGRGRLVTLNCAAVDDRVELKELLRRELTSTSAPTDRQGGTLLLDEIADLSPKAQAELLRLVEGGVFTAAGTDGSADSRFRIVATSKACLSKLAAARDFRSDLYQRLRGIEVKLPTLCERREEIPELFYHLWQRHAAGGEMPECDAAFIEQLCLYSWPGNVRELELFVRQLAFRSGRATSLGKSSLSPHMRTQSVVRTEAPAEQRDRRTSDLSRLRAELVDNGGNVASAARKLGFSRQRAYRLLGRSVADRESTASEK